MKNRSMLPLAGLAVLLAASTVSARPWRPAQIPNGSVNGCANCHINPAGGGTRNAFGKDVAAIVLGPSSAPFWGAALAQKDSDGDGFTNGQELGDPAGTGTAFAGAQVSNPGVASSKPASQPPSVSITSPANDVILTGLFHGTITVSAQASAGNIVLVELFDGATALGMEMDPPGNQVSLAIDLTNAGPHQLTAKATDYLGFSQTSPPVTITVVNPATAITIQNFKFSPTNLTVNVGDTVTWVQKDTIQHTVTSDTTPRVLDSALLSLDQTYSYTFTQAGVFPFHCTPHPNMKGTITVLGTNTTITIQNFKFSPTNLTVNVGDTVTWVQKDTIQHTVTSDTSPRVLDSALLSLDQTYSITFTNAGVFAYHCTPHPNMKGTITVVGPTNEPSAIQISSLVDNGLAVTISWGGGTGPYLLQKKLSLSHTNWFNLMTTHALYVTAPKDGQSGFYRILDQATNVVIPLSVYLTGDSEAPTPVTTDAVGSGSLSLEGLQLSYLISYSGLSGGALAAHIHGAADAAHSAGVLFPLSGASDTAGTLSGTLTLTAAQLADIVTGLAYANMHTPDHQGGEIRGQVVPLRIPVTMSGSAEVPAVTTPATGDGWITLVGNHMFYDIDYAELSSGATAAHLHGATNALFSAGVLFPLSGASGTAGTLEGEQTLTVDQLTNLLAGLTYVNIHTSTNKSGEIRGQVYPWQFTVMLMGSSEVPSVDSTGSGEGTLSLSGGELAYSINFSGLSSDATAAHIHGPADTSHSAGPLFPLSGASGTSGTLAGTQVLTPDQLAAIWSGNAYVNIHTTVNGNGEIRGQIMLKY